MLHSNTKEIRISPNPSFSKRGIEKLGTIEKLIEKLGTHPIFDS